MGRLHLPEEKVRRNLESRTRAKTNSTTFKSQCWLSDHHLTSTSCCSVLDQYATSASLRKGFAPMAAKRKLWEAPCYQEGRPNLRVGQSPEEPPPTKLIVKYQCRIQRRLKTSLAITVSALCNTARHALRLKEDIVCSNRIVVEASPCSASEPHVGRDDFTASTEPIARWGPNNQACRASVN